MTANLRREFIRRAARGAAALFAAPLAERVATRQAVVDQPYYGSLRSMLGQGDQSEHWALRALRDEYDEALYGHRRFYDALFNPDPDLLMLGSVSPAWRACITIDRQAKRKRIAAIIKAKIDAWLSDPINAATQAIKGAVMGNTTRPR